METKEIGARDFKGGVTFKKSQEEKDNLKKAKAEHKKLIRK